MFCARSSSSWRSASTTMLRNLSIVNGRAVGAHPLLAEEDRSGAGEPHRDGDGTQHRGEQQQPERRGDRSRPSLITAASPRSAAARPTGAAAPPTDGCAVRGPATSIRPGATSSSMPVPSSCHDSWRRYCAAVSLAEVTAMVSAPRRGGDLDDVVQPPTGTAVAAATGHGQRGLRRRRPPQAGELLAPHLADEIEDGGAAADDHDPLPAPTRARRRRSTQRATNRPTAGDRAPGRRRRRAAGSGRGRGVGHEAGDASRRSRPGRPRGTPRCRCRRRARSGRRRRRGAGARRRRGRRPPRTGARGERSRSRVSEHAARRTAATGSRWHRVRGSTPVPSGRTDDRGRRPRPERRPRPC